MDLFNQHNKLQNILPKDGTVNYHGFIFSIDMANFYYNRLMTTINWQNDEAIVFGKRIVTKRKVAWYAEQQFNYTYSKITKTALPFTPELLAIKKVIEIETKKTYNSCLLNLYHNGSEGMAWHSDNEKDLQKNGAIASVTFGAERKFSFKHKETKEIVDILLQHGSALIMKGTTQTYWLHRLPPSTKNFRPRINLTFRTITK